MGDRTGISWCDATWNPIRGCSRVSAGCMNCYAERVAARFSGPGQPYEGLIRVKTNKHVSTNDGPRIVSWSGKVRFVAEHLADPLRWRKPRSIFVNSMSDLFHEQLSNEEIAAVFGVMAAAHWHTHQVLTKRMRRARKWFAWLDEMIEHDAELRSGADCALSIDEARDVARTALLAKYAASALDGIGDHNATWWEQALLDYMSKGHPRASWEVNAVAWPLPNVWLGVSVENQDAADERIPELLATPAAVRFISAEPLLGPVDAKLTGCFHEGAGTPERPDEFETHTECAARIDWVIAGCESGPGARPCAASWLRSLRDQCADAGVPYFLKQAHPWMWAAGSKPPPATACDGFGVIAQGPGSRCKPGGVIELPYLDGKQHAAFPVVRCCPPTE
jgi:protein gp37